MLPNFALICQLLKKLYVAVDETKQSASQNTRYDYIESRR